MDYKVKAEQTVHVLKTLAAGAKVIKHIVKAKAVRRVVATDAHNFATVHQSAMHVMDAGGININDAIAAMPIDDLRELNDYLNDKHGKTTNAVKAKSIYQRFPMYTQFTTVIDTITVAMNRYQELVTADLEERYHNDDGVLEFDRLNMFVATTLARKEERQDMQL
jgi:hypothetical protein